MSDWQFKNLVFEGGGVKGIAYAGAIEVLEKRGVMPGIVRVAGTSAGAITAVLLALGASAKEIGQIVGGTNFRSFMDDSWGTLRDVSRLVNDYGWFKGDAFSDWMKKQVYYFTGNTELTFGDLQALAATNKKLRQLYMVGSNLSLQLPEVYSAEKTAQMPIWQATRISMSIPLFFAAMKNTTANVLVDGGVTWNYPLDIFDEKQYLIDEKAYGKVAYPTKYGDSQVFNKETLGFRVDTKDEIEAEKEGWKLLPQPIESLIDYMKVLIGFMNDMANKLHLHDNDWHRTVFLDAMGVRTTDFSLSRDKVDMLLQSGRNETNAYFQWFTDPASAPLNKVAPPVAGAPRKA